MAVGKPELVQVGSISVTVNWVWPDVFCLADVLGEQVDQDDAAEIGRRRLKLDGNVSDSGGLNESMMAEDQ